MIEIKVNCKGSDYFSLSELHILQDTKDFQLKELSKDNFEKLKNRIENKGFWFPFFVWHCKKEDKWYYTDGTQRHKVLTWMQESDEYKLPDKFPCVEIFAKNKKEAAEAILTQSTNYGKITDEGLYNFINEYDLNFQDIKLDLELSEVDLEQFENIYINDIINTVNKGDENSEWAQIFDEFKSPKKDIKLVIIFESEQKRDNYLQQSNLTIYKKQNNIIICKN